ncbi:hypothetical protein N0V90_009509 [Kalmusia sp. IMI 367209]|nr:hypothetical protein N0V90_009509 [Kalmusia sp. IMI 367209]
MQFTIAAAALVATTAASQLMQREVNYNLNATCDTSLAYAKVVNRCSYPVYLWSIDKQLGCPSGSGLKLSTGDFYHENFQNGTDGGISVKLSKYETCGGKDISQLEYKIDSSEKYGGNYLDMSFVDCTGNLEDCPGRTDGFYLKSGNDGGAFVSAVNNEHCPVFNVYNAEEAAKVSYINWDDRQTKFCNAAANLELYLCGGDAPSADDASPAPASSEAPPSTEVASTPSPTSHKQASKPAAPSSTEEALAVAAAAITSAPVAPIVKTEVVYVTKFVKRHAHGRRHQHFHA